MTSMPQWRRLSSAVATSGRRFCRTGRARRAGACRSTRGDGCSISAGAVDLHACSRKCVDRRVARRRPSGSRDGSRSPVETRRRHGLVRKAAGVSNTARVRRSVDDAPGRSLGELGGQLVVLQPDDRRRCGACSGNMRAEGASRLHGPSVHRVERSRPLGPTPRRPSGNCSGASRLPFKRTIGGRIARQVGCTSGVPRQGPCAGHNWL